MLSIKLVTGRHRGLVAMLAIGALLSGAGRAGAQSFRSLDSELAALEPRVEAALSGSDYAAAGNVVDRLDSAEASFARLAHAPKANRAELSGAYSRLEYMLSRFYNGFRKKKDDCIARSETGGDCNYTEPEALALRALYPLSWLRFEGALLRSDDPASARRLLKQAIEGFSESTLAIISPELMRENILGRAYCERELGKYDRGEYDKAIADFKAVMKDGPATRQYAAAQQGLATTYAAMGRMADAARMSSGLSASGSQRGGMEMLRLTNILKAEADTRDPTQKAEFHRQAVEFMKERAGDKNAWAIVLAAVQRNVRDPIAQFGHSSDPFEKWLLANVLYAGKQHAEAARYFLEAARSGRYPKGYRYATDIYLTERRYDQVEQALDELAKARNNPDAQWAAYMRFKVARMQWENNHSPQLETRWIDAANSYLKAYPKGQWAYEPRFRLAEIQQRNKQYVDAAKLYEQVAGNADYEFHARFNAAECNYLTLAAAMKGAAQSGAVASGVKKQPASRPEWNKLEQATIADLEATLKMAPAAERSAPARREAIRNIRGRAIYMLVALMEHRRKPDPARISTLLAGYEEQYPSMKDHFAEIAEWRIQALDQQGKYADLERDIRALVGRGPREGISNDFIKELGLNFWRASNARINEGDMKGAAADARLTVATYSYFENQVRTGKAEAKNLTGTLSILGQGYIRLGEVAKAEEVFNQVVKADPGSPDANAGLARIAQAKKDYKDAVELWTRVESVAAESDDLWYEAKYNVAEIYAAQGNVTGACNKLAVTRSEHPSLGGGAMKEQWDNLQRRLCLGNKAAS